MRKTAGKTPSLAEERRQLPEGMAAKVEKALEFAISLLRERGHAPNEVCHEFEGERGYCVGMSVILGTQADGTPYSMARAAVDMRATLWSDRGAGGWLDGYEVWVEARRWVAWAWGFPHSQDPSDFGEEAAVTPNQYAFQNGIDPVPYLENAIALVKGKPLPNDLPPLDCWPRCEEECGRVIRDADGPCEVCGPAVGYGRPRPRAAARRKQRTAEKTPARTRGPRPRQ